MLRNVSLRKAFRIKGVGAVLLLGTALGAPAGAQLVFGGSSDDEPNIVCRAWVGDSNTVYASETVPNNPDAQERFRYHADRWGGDDTHINCQKYRAMTPEYDATWRPGNTYLNYMDETVTVEKATFLPDGWDTTPTPKEIEAKRLAKTEKKNPPGAPTEAAEPKKSAGDLAAEEAAKRRAEREAEFQAKQAEYERKVAEQQNMVDEYKRAQEEVARTKAEQQAKADAAAAAF